uniref:Uncharacterized protein n=1 Tax=Klebsiella pneumoniae TaxID=573 RepID=A0A8B0STP0_KLEPN|nr:hypothetical protein [Klebsiella pneumoniae]
MQSNNKKTQSARKKVQSEPHWVMQRPQGSTKEYIPQPILITAARRSKRSHGVRKRRGSGKITEFTDCTYVGLLKMARDQPVIMKLTAVCNILTMV